MHATILQAVSTTLGRTVGLEEPLMSAGLDSLGKCTTFARADNVAQQGKHSGPTAPPEGHPSLTAYPS